MVTQLCELRERRVELWGVIGRDGWHRHGSDRSQAVVDPLTGAV